MGKNYPNGHQSQTQPPPPPPQQSCCDDAAAMMRQIATILDGLDYGNIRKVLVYTQDIEAATKYRQSKGLIHQLGKLLT